MTTIADVRERLKLEELSDEEIAPHLARAERDFRGVEFEEDTNEYDEVEAVACKALYYIAPLLWLTIQNRANEYNETLETFKDVDLFQEYWLDRCESIPYVMRDDTDSSGKYGNIGMGVA